MAVGDGTVVKTTDGLPDQVPNQNTPVSLEDAGGNEVILQLDSGIYVGYGHLRPGSVQVEPGERARLGDVVGELWQLRQLHWTAPARAADDEPVVPRRQRDNLFAIDSFRFDGTVPSLVALLEADKDGTPMPIDPALAGERHRVGLTGLDVVTFPIR